MPRRRRRDEAPRRRWPFYLLFAAGVLAGVALWAYSPSLPAEMTNRPSNHWSLSWR